MHFAELFQSFKTFKQFKALNNATLISDLFEQPEIRVFPHSVKT
jgi:hypothetical protein